MIRSIALLAVLLSHLWHSLLTAGEDVPWTSAADYIGRYYVILKPGDGKTLTAEAMVFEHISEQHSLRLIFETKLLNKIEPRVMELSPDGRFLVTLEDYAESGTSPFTLVIYDLVRREHTAYKGSDFLDPVLIEKLPKRPLFNGFAWFSVGAGFSPDSKQFFPTSPKYCERDSKPYVVVDLPSRTVAVKELPLESKVKLVTHQGIGWKMSKEIAQLKCGIELPIAIKRFSFNNKIMPSVFKLSDRSTYKEVMCNADEIEFR